MKKIHAFLLALLIAALCPAAALAEESTSPVWTVAPTGVVQVDENGLITALAPGTATVSVSWKGLTGFVEVTVDSVPCKFASHDIDHIDDIENHTPAVCGVPGHCAASGWHSSQVLNRFCPNERQHRACEIDATHYCGGEYGCQRFYLCEDGGKHTECIVCGKPWCYSGTEDHPVSHKTLSCGHRACDPSVPSHALLDCEVHSACQIPAEQHAAHALLPCGHAACGVSDGGNHHTLICDIHYACQTPVNQYSDHAVLDCGHALCETVAGEDHVSLLPCGVHRVCQAPADKHGSHVLLSCGHTACSIEHGSDHVRGTCEHFLCDGQTHSLCAACLGLLCDGRDHTKADCGHAQCVISSNAAAHEPCARCGQPQCSGDHADCALCGAPLCVGSHGEGVCTCPVCGDAAIHEPAACGAHLACEPGDHDACVCGMFKCEGDHSACTSAASDPE